jgi:fructose-1,6-bisphosphatase
VTFNNGVHRFVLDDSIGEFIYMGPMVFPAKSKTIYSCNEGNFQVRPSIAHGGNKTDRRTNSN